jgi:hypothetical protein
MFQGSSDRNSTYSTHYEEHLRRLVADARAELGEELRWLQVVSPTWNTGEHVLRVQAAQRTVANSLHNMEMVESDNPLGTPIVFSDGTHPDLASTERIGVVMARAWVDSFPTYRNFMFGSGYGDSLSNPTHDVDGDGASLLEYAMGGDIARYGLAEWMPELIHENEETFLDVVVRDNDANSIHLDAQFTANLDSPMWYAGLEAIHSSQVDVPSGFVRKRYTSPLEPEGLNSQFARVSVESIFDPILPDMTVALTSNMVVRGPSSVAANSLSPTGFTASGTHSGILITTADANVFSVRAGQTLDIDFQLSRVPSSFRVRLVYWNSGWTAASSSVTTALAGENAISIVANYTGNVYLEVYLSDSTATALANSVFSGLVIRYPTPAP